MSRPMDSRNQEIPSMNIYSNIPYTYLVGWSTLNKWYYGVRFSKNCHPSDLWVNYFTSSNTVAKFRKKHGEPDVIEIRKIFTDVSSAIEWEAKVLKRLKIFEHQDVWLNKNIAGAIAPHTHGTKLKGRKRSPEAILKSAITRKTNGKPSPLKGKKNPKISESLRGKVSPNKGRKFGPAPEDRKIKQKESRKRYFENGGVGPNKGRIMSDEQKLKRSQTLKGKPKAESHSKNVSLAKQGTKQLVGVSGDIRKAKPGTDRWITLLAQGYLPSKEKKNQK